MRNSKPKTPSLYDLFRARFSGMDERQIRAIMAYDERVQSFSQIPELDAYKFESWQNVRKQICHDLELLGVNNWRQISIFFAYYAELNRIKGNSHSHKVWLLIDASEDEQVFKTNCFKLNRYDILLKLFELDQDELRQIMQECFDRIGERGAGNGYFWDAFETAQKLGDKKMISSLCKMAFANGEPQLAQTIAEKRDAPLTKQERVSVACGSIRMAQKGWGLSYREAEYLIEIRNLGLGSRLIRALLRKFKTTTSYPHHDAFEILRLADKLGYRFTDRELNQMWAKLKNLQSIDAVHKLPVLRLLMRRDRKMRPIYLSILHEALISAARGGSVEGMLKHAKELRHKLTSRDWFERSLHNNFKRSDSLELLALSLVNETGATKGVRAKDIEVSPLH